MCVVYFLLPRHCSDIAFHFAAGRKLALRLAKAGKEWKAAAAVRMPEARGDIREIMGQPVFIPLQKLATIYGKVGLSMCQPCYHANISSLTFQRSAAVTDAPRTTG
jgi:beta-ring hydroxylase